MGCVVIVGGELFNKGAQAMTFTIVNELKNRFPQKEIILFSGRDYKRSQKELSQYTFRIIKSIDLKTAFYLAGGLYRMLAKAKKSSEKETNGIKEVLKNADFLIDISGYLLGSNWGFIRMLEYIFRIKLAKHFNIAAYIMPQSFGPFDHKGIKGLIINYYIKRYLKYPKVIYAREKEGYALLTQKYGLNNVKLSNDLVLLNRGIDINNIYSIRPDIKTLKMISGKDNVAIIPNMKNFVYGNKEEIAYLYGEIVNKLISNGKNVYLLRHAVEDIEACVAIKNKFLENEKVRLITDEFSCIEYDQLVGQFDFLIASRFHSIVHAYKRGVPCIAIGWATKYNELLCTFNQGKYIFDVGKNVDTNTVLQAIDDMTENFQAESLVIKKILADIQVTNIFDVLEEHN